MERIKLGSAPVSRLCQGFVCFGFSERGNQVWMLNKQASLPLLRGAGFRLSEDEIARLVAPSLSHPVIGFS